MTQRIISKRSECHIAVKDQSKYLILQSLHRKSGYKVKSSIH